MTVKERTVMAVSAFKSKTLPIAIVETKENTFIVFVSLLMTTSYSIHYGGYENAFNYFNRQMFVFCGA